MSKRKYWVLTLAALGLSLWVTPASAAFITIAAPVSITGAELGNPGIVGTVNPELDFSGAQNLVLSDGALLNAALQDVLVVTISLAAGSTSVGVFGIGAGSAPIIPNPVGAGTFLGDVGKAPTLVVVGPFTTLRGDFTFATLDATDTSVRLYVAFEPGGSALTGGETVNFMIGSSGSFTVQGIVSPEPSALWMLGAALAALAFTKGRQAL